MSKLSAMFNYKDSLILIIKATFKVIKVYFNLTDVSCIEGGIPPPNAKILKNPKHRKTEWKNQTHLCPQASFPIHGSGLMAVREDVLKLILELKF